MSAPPPKPEPNCRTPPAPAALLVPMSLIVLMFTLPLSKDIPPVKLLFGLVRVMVCPFSDLSPRVAVAPFERMPLKVALLLFRRRVVVPLAATVVRLPLMM